MARPGADIITRDTAASRGSSSTSGRWFIAGITGKGAKYTLGTGPITSLSDYINKYGQRSDGQLMYDSAEVFFREGGRELHVSRVLGLAPIKAAISILDSGAVEVFKIRATSPGTWGNDLNGGIVAGDAAGEFKIRITSDSDPSYSVLSYSLVDKSAAFVWAQTQTDIELVDGASVNDPTVAPLASLTGGTDDRGTITNTEWSTAISAFDLAAGPGQVSAPGISTTAVQTALVAHAAANNRVAFLGAMDTPTLASVTSQASTLRALGSPSVRYAALFGPWLKAPGLLQGTTRDVPPEAAAAGLVARVETETKNPNQAAAGPRGLLQFCYDTKPYTGFSDAVRTAANESGLNAFIVKSGRAQLFGFRTLVNPQTDRLWRALTGTRLHISIVSDLGKVADAHQFDQIDGKGIAISAFHKDVEGVMRRYFGLGALYGDTFSEVALIDTGSSVNTPETIANDEMHAVVNYRTSPMAEWIQIIVSRVPITQEVA
jgi:Phage tail sheath protein subtilisin-like domain